ncbi:MAG: hypothetical protein KY469_20180 [Actinobacteria bacterium]|nr:hypothetical protein [Actinomycetota bacterium]
MWKRAELIVLLAMAVLVLLVGGASAQEEPYPPREGPTRVLPTTIEREPAPGDEGLEGEPAPDVAADVDERQAPAPDEVSGERQAPAPDEVSGEGLARTGVPTATILSVAVVVLAGGGLLLWSQRRSRRAAGS